MKIRITILLLLATLGLFAQTIQKALWPIKNGNIGENIIGKPGQYINNEKNYAELFIQSPEGTPVVAPEDGVVTSFSYYYMNSLSRSNGFSVTSAEPKDDFDIRNELSKQLRKKKHRLLGDIAKYISISMEIKVGKEEQYYIVGLRPTKFFQTGEKVKRGDIIGTVGYAYSAFEIPHISISRSINSKSEDPMGVFGIVSTFKKSNPININYTTHKHPVNTLKIEFNIFRKSLEEIHPGLYDYTSKQQMDSLFNGVYYQLNKPLTSLEFYKILRPIITNIRDNHTRISTVFDIEEIIPPINFGFDGCDLFILNSFNNKYPKGHKISYINGISSSDIISKCKVYYYNEGFNKITNERRMMESITSYAYLFSIINGKQVTFKMQDGKIINLPYSIKEEFPTENFKRWNFDTVNFSTKQLKDDIAYLDINTFRLNEVEEDSIRSFIKQINQQNASNLVIDVRDNGGGDEKVGYRILSYLISSPQNTFNYKMVKSNTIYPMLKYSDGWADDQIVFPEYVKVEGKKGFYDYGDKDTTIIKVIKPNSKTHFEGNIYILANEYSASMASDFAAMLMGQHNCKIIGRETGTCYYQMNAEKFANILLLSTGINLRIPMVKIVTRNTPNPRIPYGHGVIPDYEVKLTLDELIKPKDVILDRTLDIIESDKKMVNTQ